MRTAPILDRVAGLGSDKWRVHFRARQMLARGEPVILLTIFAVVVAVEVLVTFFRRRLI